MLARDGDGQEDGGDGRRAVIGDAGRAGVWLSGATMGVHVHAADRRERFFVNNLHVTER
jgi:hypothetical protein